MYIRVIVMAGILALISAPVCASEDLLPKAEKVYKQFCAHCHGLKMVNPGTGSFDLRKYPKNKRGQFFNTVKKGKRDMPAWGDILLDDELKLLWYYVATRAGKEPPPEGDPATEKQSSDPNAEKSSSNEEPVPLKVCLARNGGVMSGYRSSGGAGLDYEVAKAVAGAMSRKLEVTWFESEQDEQSNPVKETYAMLSYGLCDMAPGFMLYESGLGPYSGQRAALPRWDDRPDYLGQSFQVDLKPIEVSAPYSRIEMGIVVGPGVKRKFSSVADMDGLVVGVEQGTLAGILTMRQGTEHLAATAKLFNPGPSFLWKMENGEFEAALVTVTAFDFHKKQNMITKLRLTDYRHPIGFNLAIAVLETEKNLLAPINKTIAGLLDSGEMMRLAKKSGVSYARPREPIIRSRITITDILTIK